MSSITFKYQGEEINVSCEEKEKLSPIIQRFCTKVQLQKENVNFLYQVKSIDEQMTEDQISFNENNKKIIYVEDKNMNGNQKGFIKSNMIICPECQESSLISLKNYKISISNCKNGHNSDNIDILDFPNTQMVNLSKIICGECKEKNMGTEEEDSFYRCVECKMNLCLLCKSGHDPNHNIFNYSNKHYICDEHGKMFESYCYDCKKNICLSCEDNHTDHKTTSLKDIKRTIKYLNKNNAQVETFRDNINIMKEKIKKIIDICNKVIDTYDILYNIIKDIDDRFKQDHLNFQLLENYNIINNEFDKDIEPIIKENDIINQFSNILKIYDKITKSEESENSIILKYKIGYTDKIKIFGENFVKNNYNKCKIVYDNNTYNLI